MSLVAGKSPVLEPQLQSGPAAASWARRRLPLILILIAAAILRHFVVANTDVSWILTLGEKVLAGQRLYVDLIELNPPASILLYVPAIVIGRLLQLPPEWVVDGLVFLAIGLSLWLAGRIAAQARLLERVDGGGLAACAAAALAILPAQAFGEREHIALISLLPALVVYAARATGASPGLSSAIVAGVSAGLAVIIKPHFAMGIVAAVIATTLCAKSWRPLAAIENWIAAGLIALYGAFVAIAFPSFLTDVVPLVNAVYVPIRKPFPTLVGSPGVWLSAAALLGLAVVKRRAAVFPPHCLLLATSSGLFLAFLVQGKGWPYHSYPLLALAVIALAAAATERNSAAGPAAITVKRRIERLGPMLLIELVIVTGFVWMNLATDTAALVEPIRRIKPQPAMLAITPDIAVGHPLVRRLGGRWVGSACSLWITAGVLQRQWSEALDVPTRERLQAYMARDRAMLAEDIRRERPDIVLVDEIAFDWNAWARSDPALSRALNAYSEAERVGGMVILRRNP
jgi:hypothetical protein